MKLRAKTFLLFTVAGALIILAMGVLQYATLREAQLKVIGEEISKQLEHLDFALTRFMEEAESDLAALAADERVRSSDDRDFTNFLDANQDTFEYRIGPSEQKIIEIFNAFRVNHPYVSSTYMGRENGSFVRSHKRERPTRYDPRTRPWYILAKNNPGKVMRTAPYHSVTTLDVNIGVVTALIDARSGFFGVIGSDITLQNLTGYIAGFKVSDSGKMFLLDGDGTVLAAPNEAMLFENVRRLFPSGGGLLMQTNGGDVQVKTPEGRQYAYVRTSPSIGWRIVAMIPESEIQKKISGLVFANVLSFSTGVVLLSLCTLFGLYRYIILPVGRLTESARHINQTGDLSHRIVIDTRDEIKELADSFNDMMEGLSASERKLNESRHELQRERDLLEDRVKERTIEIEAANQELVNEVAERKLAESRVRNSSQRLAQIISFLPDATFVIDAEGRVTAWNQAMERMTGIAAELMLGKGDHEYALPFYGERRRDLIDMVMDWHEPTAAGYFDIKREPDAASAEVFFPSLRGEERYLWAAARRLYDESGKIAGAIESVRDVTEWKNTVQALKKSEGRHRLLFDNAKEAIVVIQHRHCQFVNPQAEEIFGYSREELASRPIDDFIHPDDRATVMERYTRRMNDESPQEDYVFRILDSAGEIRWTELRAVRIPWEGEPAILCFLTDITARVLAQREIEIQRRYLEQLFETSHEAIVQVDENDRVIRVNEEFLNLFGYEAKEALDETLERLIVPDKKLEDFKWLRARLTGGEKLWHETVRRRKDGALVDVSISGTPTTIDGAGAGAFVVYQDIRERKQAEEALRQAKEDAEAANRAKSMFLANMSHEIRTPLNAILGFTQLLLRDPEVQPAHRSSLETVKRSGEHLLKLLNDVLEMSKIEAGHATVNAGVADLDGLLADLEGMFRILAKEKGLSLEIAKAGTVPRWIWADEQKLRQILNNLLGNAVKFTAKGGVILRVRTASAEAPPRDATHPGSEAIRLVFEVEDTGHGVPEGDRERIFSLFEQLTIGSRMKGGSGLGLAISKAYVELMGGTIDVQGGVGRGSVFRFDISARDVSDEASPQAPCRRQVTGLKAGRGELCILVADDNGANREILVRLLESVGFQVREAADGREACTVFETWRPRLILMDLVMPEMDGFEAIQEIRNAPDGAGIPIIAVSASVLSEDRERVLSSGADAFLRKPFTEDEIFSLLEKFLKVEYVYEEEQAPSPQKVGGSVESAPFSLDLLPDDLISRLRKAAVSLDVDLLYELIPQVALRDEKISVRLQELIVNYEFEILKDLLKRDKV